MIGYPVPPGVIPVSEDLPPHDDPVKILADMVEKGCHDVLTGAMSFEDYHRWLKAEKNRYALMGIQLPYEEPETEMMDDDRTP